MESTLLHNLRRNRAFDAAVKKGESIDKIIAAVILSILTETDDEARDAAIADLESMLVRQFRLEYQPASHAIAAQNAARVLKAMPAPPTALDLRTARQTAVAASTRDRTRVEIVRATANDKGNTLANGLKKAYLEPGPSVGEKRRRLMEQFREQEQKRQEFDKADEAFRRGDADVRPRRPQLDNGSRFTEDVKQGIREQARRSGTDAETAAFAKAGYTQLAWVTVNASEACPDCRLRQGVKGDLAFWDRHGRPGSGQTVCGPRCQCFLVPAQAVVNHPGLKNGLNQPKQGVITSRAEAEILNATR